MRTFCRLMIRRAGMVVAAISIGHVPLVAHDLWIHPTTFVPDPGAVVGIRLRVGDNLVGDPVPRDPSLVNQFVFVDDAGRKPVVGRDGADPAGFLRVATPGLIVVGYRSNASTLELPADKFNEYLKEEGLDAVMALRARRNQTATQGREIFYRCAKSLLLAGHAAAARDRQLGFTLELIAERNPYAIGAGEQLPFLLMYENQPLPGALVVAINRRDPSAKLTARTDEAGRVRFSLTRADMWLVKAVHMVPARADANAEWVSYWASLTFGESNRLDREGR